MSSLEAASLTTIGAIAVQGVRQANVTFGETVAVIGVGLVGVLAIQVLRAAGCRVVAIDLSSDRAAKAISLGAHLGLCTGDPGLESAVATFSRYGVDAALITAATKSADPLELAAKLLRDRGRISVIGDVGMGVSRANMYRKEISLSMSRSYGPGRYDPRYEEGGQDYPIGFVRWTEKRNMEAFLDLLSAGVASGRAIAGASFPGRRRRKGLRRRGGWRLYWDHRLPCAGRCAVCSEAALPAHVRQPRPKDKLRVGCIGAGGFARGSHLSPSPLLRRADVGICCHQHRSGRRIGAHRIWFHHC